MDVPRLIFVQAVRLLTEDAPATGAIPLGPVERPIQFSLGQSWSDTSGISGNLLKSLEIGNLLTCAEIDYAESTC